MNPEWGESHRNLHGCADIGSAFKRRLDQYKRGCYITGVTAFLRVISEG